MKMPFGKYKDSEITDLPDAYLNWLDTTATGILATEVDKEILRRRHQSITERLPKQVFMEKLGALLMQCPEEFLTETWFVKIPSGTFKFKKEKDGQN